MLETIEIDVDQSNELLFRVKVEGVEQAPAQVRLVCEAGDVSYMFTGKALGTDDVIRFVLPALEGRLPEGQYVSRVEVLIENRYFAPVSFNLKAKKAVKVVAEAISRRTVAPEPRVEVQALDRREAQTLKARYAARLRSTTSGRTS